MMNPDESNNFFREHLTTKRAMVILRGMEPGAAVILAAKAWDAGVSLVEVPLQNDRDVESLREVIEAGADRECYTGAGTIISKRHADKAADAGANFTVAPGFSSVVAQRSLELGMAHLPGVATGSEIQLAITLGLGWVKAFPADALGERWFVGMRGPFPDVGIVATGGVGAENCVTLLEAGASAVAFGSSFANMTRDELATVG